MNAETNALETSVAFAAEGGIESALRVVRRTLERGPANRVVVFCGNYGGDHAQRIEDLLLLKDRHLDRLAVSVVMDREPDEPALLSGRLDAKKVTALAGRLFDPHAVREFFVCGSDDLAAEVTGALASLGVEPSRIHRESSERTDVAEQPANVDAGPAAEGLTRVTVIMDGRRREFSMRTGEDTILEAAAQAGIELPSSCRAGVCSTCRTKLLRGHVELAQNYALEDWELEQGFILACQAHPTTPEIELTYDET